MDGQLPSISNLLQNIPGVFADRVQMHNLKKQAELQSHVLREGKEDGQSSLSHLTDGHEVRTIFARFLE